MTTQSFEKALDLRKQISDIEKTVPVLNSRIERFNDYIEFMDGRVKPISRNGKNYKKVEIKFNINDIPTDLDARDMFDIVEENKKDFVEFLKKCQKNYEKKLQHQAEIIVNLEEEFANLDSDKDKEIETLKAKIAEMEVA